MKEFRFSLRYQPDGHNSRVEMKSKEAVNLKKNRNYLASETEAKSLGVWRIRERSIGGEELCILINSSCDECINYS